MASVFQNYRREILSKQERLETASKHAQQPDMNLEKHPLLTKHILQICVKMGEKGYFIKLKNHLAFAD